MLRNSVCAVLTLFVLGARGERIAAVYREGAELVLEEKNALAMEPGDMSMSVNGVEVPPEVLQENGAAPPSMEDERTVRWRDRVLEVVDGRPTKIRREFESLRQRSVEEGEESEKTGPLEGRVLVLEEHDGAVTGELEEGDEVESQFLEDHRMTHEAELLLPDSEVAVGDKWQPEEDSWRAFIGIDSGPMLFEEDEEEEDPMDELLDDVSAVTGEVEFAAIEERDGLRCAVLAFHYEIQAAVDDPTAMGEDLEEATGKFEMTMRGDGRFWYALEEGRPVALQQDIEGEMAAHLEASVTTEEGPMQMKMEMTCSYDGETTCAWSVPEGKR